MVAKLLSRWTLLAATAAAAIGGGLAWATPSTATSTLLGTGIYAPFNIARRIPSEWAVKIEAKDGVKVATQSITFQPGKLSGWHSHPGPVFITVKEGTMTFYDENCTPKVISASDPVNGFLDAGDDRHLAVNESGAPAVNIVTYFVPPDAPLRVDQPAPATCPIQ